MLKTYTVRAETNHDTNRIMRITVKANNERAAERAAEQKFSYLGYRHAIITEIRANDDRKIRI